MGMVGHAGDLWIDWDAAILERKWNDPQKPNQILS